MSSNDVVVPCIVMDVSCESVRGCQFTSEHYQRLLETHWVICSMVGSCADNAVAENCFCVLNR